MSSSYNKYLKKINIPNNNREVFFLSLLLIFSILSRVLPFVLVTLLLLITFLLVVGFDFYMYTNKIAKNENKTDKTLEYSWGFIKEKKDLMDLTTFSKYVTQKDYFFFKNYFLLNLDKAILILFIFGDIIVAFKNLSFYDSGIYIMMSLFTKFVFMGYLFLSQTYKKMLVGEKDTEENLLDIFYSQINSLLSFFAVLFIFFFILSRYIVEIFFGSSYLPYHPSLPFILFANISLAVVLSIYKTAKKVNKKNTNAVCKTFSVFFAILFVFISINYIDTVTYFVIGSSTLLSIFLYNFVIKKPEYIASTYNHLF